MWLISWTLSAGSEAAFAAPVANVVVAATVSVSRSARRLILPLANSSSLVAMKPSMVVLPLLAPERVLLDRIRDLDVVIERIVDVQAAVPSRLRSASEDWPPDCA